jgi:hypothetical protein
VYGNAKDYSGGTATKERIKMSNEFISDFSTLLYSDININSVGSWRSEVISHAKLQAQ